MRKFIFVILIISCVFLHLIKGNEDDPSSHNHDELIKLGISSVDSTANNAIQLETRLKRKKLRFLKQICINLEAVIGIDEISLDGLHKCLHLNTKEDLVSYILTRCIESENGKLLNEKDFFNVVVNPIKKLPFLYVAWWKDNPVADDKEKLEEPKKEDELPKKVETKHSFFESVSSDQIFINASRFETVSEKLRDFDGESLLELNNIIEKSSVEELRNYCLKLEKYVRIKSGRHIMGGINDYVHKMEKQQCLDYINNVCSKNIELLQRGNFYDVVADKVVSSSVDSKYFPPPPPQKIPENPSVKYNSKIETLKKYLKKMDRKCLRGLGYTAEKYQSEKKSDQRKSLKDMENKMTNDQYIDFITEVADDYEELQNIQNLMMLGIKYGFDPTYE